MIGRGLAIRAFSAVSFHMRNKSCHRLGKAGSFSGWHLPRPGRVFPTLHTVPAVEGLGFVYCGHAFERRRAKRSRVLSKPSALAVNSAARCLQRSERCRSSRDRRIVSLISRAGLGFMTKQGKCHRIAGLAQRQKTPEKVDRRVMRYGYVAGQAMAS